MCLGFDCVSIWFLQFSECSCPHGTRNHCLLQLCLELLDFCLLKRFTSVFRSALSLVGKFGANWWNLNAIWMLQRSHFLDLMSQVCFRYVPNPKRCNCWSFCFLASSSPDAPAAQALQDMDGWRSADPHWWYAIYVPNFTYIYIYTYMYICICTLYDVCILRRVRLQVVIWLHAKKTQGN